jgi:cold shock protein
LNVHRERRRRGFDDDDDYPPVGNQRDRYRRQADEGIFSPLPLKSADPPAPETSGGRLTVGHRPADDDEPAQKARVKWFNAEKGYGFVALTDGGESIFLPMRVVGPDADLPTGTTLVVRVGLDLKGKGRSVVSVLDVDRSTAIAVGAGPNQPLIAAVRTERGRLARKTASGVGFFESELGGVDIFVPRSCFTDVDVKPGDRIEVDIGNGSKGPLAVRIRRI